MRWHNTGNMPAEHILFSRGAQRLTGAPRRRAQRKPTKERMNTMLKKWTAVLLAAMLLMGTAMAASAPTPTQGTNMSVVVNTTTSQYDSTNTSATATSSPSVNTQLWLQVDATGQIDVTVPLVLVFKTDIDGGKAATGTDGTYKITNNSTAPVVVTSIKATDDDTTVSSTSASGAKMTLATYNESSMAQDNYGVKLTVADGKFGTQNDSTDLDLHGTTTTAATRAAKDGGLFKIGSSTNDNTKIINAQLVTGKLSFVTVRATGTTDTMDEKKGVKLMTITYTVGLDTSTAYGTDIPTANELLKKQDTP